MAKYIKVKIELEKTVKVEKNDLNEAINEVNKSLAELEYTPEWLNSRNIEIKENKAIKDSAQYIAELFSKQLVTEHHKDDVLDFIKIAIDNEIADYVFDETIDLLESKYNITFVDKKI